MLKLEKEAYKFDGKVERRAFSVLVKHLWEKRELNLKECYHILSGVRIENPLKKLTKPIVKSLLWKWHKLGLITIYQYGAKVRLNLSPFLFFYVDNETLQWLAKQSVNYWLKNAPHGLKQNQKGEKNDDKRK